MSIRIVAFSFKQADSKKIDPLRGMSLEERASLFDELCRDLAALSTVSIVAGQRLFLCIEAQHNDERIRHQLDEESAYTDFISFQEVAPDDIGLAHLQNLMDRLPRLEARSLQARTQKPTWPPLDAPLRVARRPVDAGNSGVLLVFSKR